MGVVLVSWSGSASGGWFIGYFMDGSVGILFYGFIVAQRTIFIVLVSLILLL